MLNSMSVRIAQNYPELASFHYKVDDAGNTTNAIDFSKDSVASRMMKNLMSAEYGINYADNFIRGKIDETDYKRSVLTNYKMVKNSLAAINAYRLHEKSGSQTQFKYTSENLFNVRDLKQFKNLNIENHEKRVKELQDEYKKKQRQRKLRLQS